MSTITLERPKQQTSLPMPGGVWTTLGFTVFDTATDEQLHKSIIQLDKLNASSKWALGDIGIAIQERKRRELALQAKDLRARAAAIEARDADSRATRREMLEKAQALETKGVIEYTSDLARMLGINAGNWRNAVSLARFYEPSLRSDGLRPEHHIAAMKAAGGALGDVKKARHWLTQAVENNWRASDLRRHVNQAMATAKAPTLAPLTNHLKEMDAADTWASAHMEDAITPAAAQSRLTRWASLIKYVGRMRAIAAQ